MNNKKTNLKASCHCGSVHLDLFLSNGIDKITRCNCSICSKGKGFGMICVPIDDVNIVQGDESITEYIFNTTTAPHFFCIICGIHTHHKSRATPDKLCVNVACIDGINIDDYNNQIISFDGINHPRDL